MIKLTQERLKALLNYDQETGVFYRKIANGTAKAGDVAGHACRSGYIKISVDGQGQFLAHRLAWFYVTGEWPENHTDHINGCRSDNRFCNLRKATAKENCANTGPQANNTSGVKGVYWSTVRRKWVAQIGHDRKVINLGGFPSLDLAIAARREAENQYQGEFRCQA